MYNIDVGLQAHKFVLYSYPTSLSANQERASQIPEALDDSKGRTNSSQVLN